jgi:site-specific recombinase XerD
MGEELTRLSAKTVNRHFQAIRQFYKWALAQEEITVDPTR